MRTLLENNIFGIDIDKEAVRVASFSLYLTMLDSIDPLKYWENEVRFPRLRGQRLINSDFFAEDKEGFRTNEDRATYDLVLGNAPWGRSTITQLSRSWARFYGWDDSITYGNIGPVFLPKALALVKECGIVCMIQPAGVLLFNQVGTAQKFRKKLFSQSKVEEIVNLSALCYGLLKDSLSPSCIVTISHNVPDGEPLIYICPKSRQSNEDNYCITIEPQDINQISLREVMEYDFIWSTLMWGGRRDLDLIRRLSQAPNLKKLEENGVVATRQGIVRGDRKRRQDDLIGKRILSDKDFPNGTFLIMNSTNLPINYDPEVHSKDSTDFSAFSIPQMILKQSWKKNHKRFQAAIVNSADNESVLCSESYITVHVIDQNSEILEMACLSYSSKLAVYYLLLSSGRFASYRAEPNVDDLLRVPIPKFDSNLTTDIKTFHDIDQVILNAFSIKESENILIEDIVDLTLLDFKGNKSSSGRQITHRTAKSLLEDDEEIELRGYCEYFLRVIKAGFGQGKEVCATIFHESTDDYLPIRLVAIYLNKSIHDGIKVETINSQVLLDLLNRLNKQFIEQRDPATGGIFYQRVARVYASTSFEGEQVPTVYLIKPDRIRYWTRSMALRDADEVVADIMSSPCSSIHNV